MTPFLLVYMNPIINSRMKVRSLVTGVIELHTVVLFVREGREYDLPDEFVPALIEKGTVEALPELNRKPKRGRPGPTELKNNE